MSMDGGGRLARGSDGVTGSTLYEGENGVHDKVCRWAVS